MFLSRFRRVDSRRQGIWPADLTSTTRHSVLIRCKPCYRRHELMVAWPCELNIWKLDLLDLNIRCNALAFESLAVRSQKLNGWYLDSIPFSEFHENLRLAAPVGSHPNKRSPLETLQSTGQEF